MKYTYNKFLGTDPSSHLLGNLLDVHGMIRVELGRITEPEGFPDVDALAAGDLGLRFPKVTVEVLAVRPRVHEVLLLRRLPHEVEHLLLAPRYRLFRDPVVLDVEEAVVRRGRPDGARDSLPVGEVLREHGRQVDDRNLVGRAISGRVGQHIAVDRTEGRSKLEFGDCGHLASHESLQMQIDIL